MTGPFLERRGSSARVGEDACIGGDALGLIEVSSIARGHVVADTAVKKAPVEIVLARALSPGKHVTLLIGGVADVKEAMAAALAVAAEKLIGSLELALVAPQLVEALRGRVETADGRAIGIVETATVASALLAADAACKTAELSLLAVRLADGIGGKAYFTLQGEQGDVEAGLFAVRAITAPDLLVGEELIARPHEDFVRELARGD